MSQQLQPRQQGYCDRVNEAFTTYRRINHSKSGDT